MAMSLPLGSLVYFDISTNSTPDWKALTEHNRQPISISTNRIQRVNRMSNGALRKFFVAEKREFSLSWNMLPSFSNLTVDGAWGKEEISDFYEGPKGQQTFKMKLVYGKNQTAPYATREEIITVSFTSCSFELVKRNVKDWNVATQSLTPAQEFWNVSLSVEEV